MIAVSICICTFRRPAGLLRLLRSLARLDAATPPFEIIVADNDAARSGEASVAQARAEGLAVTYVVEPRRGIAQARNCSLAPARGTFVAFIDDDEEADPQWLRQLWDEVHRHDADGGIGAVLPRFPPGVPRWLVEGGFYDRPRPATGQVLDRRGMRTGNALVRRDALAALAGPFDERFDLTGGEDSDLFRRLVAGGRRIIAVDSAVVYEHLPPHRARVRWLLRRRFVAGIAAGRMYVREIPPTLRAPWQRTRALAGGLRWAAAALVALPRSRVTGLQHLSQAANHLGRLAFYLGFIARPYGDESWR